jgi:hypothetical protein
MASKKRRTKRTIGDLIRPKGEAVAEPIICMLDANRALLRRVFFK